MHDIFSIIRLDLLCGEAAVGVTFSNHEEIGFAIKLRGTRARAHLKVISEATSRTAPGLTKRVRDVGTNIQIGSTLWSGIVPNTRYYFLVCKFIHPLEVTTALN